MTACANCKEAMELIQEQKTMIENLQARAESAISLAERAMESGIALAQHMAELISDPEAKAQADALMAEFQQSKAERKELEPTLDLGGGNGHSTDG